MAKKKTNKFFGVFSIFFSCIRTYFLYLDQTSKYLLFPVLGQIVSIALIFLLTYLFIVNYEILKSSCAFLSSDKTLYTIFWVIIAPLIVVMVKAIYDYIIAFTSLNLLFYTHSGKKNPKQVDFKANDNVIQRKLFSYVILILLISILMFVPFLGIFLCLAFQVFAIEGSNSPFKAILRSVEMVKANFIPTIMMLALCFVATYCFLPAIFIWTCEKINVYYFFIHNCEKFFSIISYDDLFMTIDSFGIIAEPIKTFFEPITMSKIIVEFALSFIIIAFTLPFRCSCFTELYKLFDSEKIKENSKVTDEIVKRATGKKGKN